MQLKDSGSRFCFGEVLLLALLLASLVALLFFSDTVFASGKDQLDQVLDGFDEPAGSAEKSDPLSEALGGFDQEKPKEKGPVDEALEGFDQPGEKPKAADPVEQALEGFDQPESPAKSKGAGEDAFLPGWLDFYGEFSLHTALNFSHDAPKPGEADYRGLSSLRFNFKPKLDIGLPHGWELHTEADFFYDAAFSINGRDQYTQGYLDAYEAEAELNDLWLEGELLPSLDLKLGRQIVIWGTSDNLRVTDVLNPLDRREPGMTDIEDLRLPVTMAKLDYFFGNLSLGAIALMEMRPQRLPAFGSDFYPGKTPPPPEDGPGWTWGADEHALSLTGTYSGFDFSLYAARFYNRSAHVEATPTGLIRRYARLGMLGGAAILARGNWLIKGEAAWFDGFKFLAAQGETFQRADVFVGLEYSGISETSISLELAERHLFNWREGLADGPEDAREDDVQWAFRLSHDMMHDMLTVTLVATLFGLSAEEGSFERLQLDYELGDGLTLTGGAVLYQGGSRTAFSDYSSNDRLFAKLTYNF